jgi:hypothetical protein
MLDAFKEWWSSLLMKRGVARARELLEETGKMVHIRLDPPGIELESFDPDRLKYGQSDWMGDAYFPFWNETLPIILVVKGSRPSEQQQKLLVELTKPNDSFRDLVEASLLKYYQHKVYGQFQILRDGRDVTQEVIPKVESVNELRPLLFPPSVFIVNDAPLWVLDVGGRWSDCGRGVTVKCNGWEIVELC